MHYFYLDNILMNWNINTEISAEHLRFIYTELVTTEWKRVRNVTGMYSWCNYHQEERK